MKWLKDFKNKQKSDLDEILLKEKKKWAKKYIENFLITKF